MDGCGARRRPGRGPEPSVRRRALGHPADRGRPHRGHGAEEAPPTTRTPSSLCRAPRRRAHDAGRDPGHDRATDHRGTATLRTLLLDARRSLRSPLEAEFLDFVRAAALPPPETNVFIEGYEIDAVWREQRLIVELDGYATHGTRRAFERDRDRDRKLIAKGWRTIRITDLQLGRPAELAQELLSSIRA